MMKRTPAIHHGKQGSYQLKITKENVLHELKNLLMQYRKQIVTSD